MSKEIHILIPVYNTAKFIEGTLNSVCVQNYNNMKVIIINDGSTDGTNKIIEEKIKGDDRFTYKSYETNRKSLSSVREELVKISMELNPDAYFTWLDSDDTITDKEYISKLMQKFEETGADVCLFNFDVVFENDTEKLRKNAQGLFKDKENSEKILQKVSSHPMGIAFEDFPEVGCFTTLGCTKAYSPKIKSIWPNSDNTDMIYEDFLYIAALFLANKITAFSPEYKPRQFVRREFSATGDRKHYHFTRDILERLESFVKLIEGISEVKENVAKQVVETKVKQYKKTLITMIEIEKDGFTKEVLNEYDNKAKEFFPFLFNNI